MTRDFVVAYMLAGALFLGSAVAYEVAGDGTEPEEAAVTILGAALGGAIIGVPLVVLSALCVAHHYWRRSRSTPKARP